MPPQRAIFRQTASQRRRSSAPGAAADSSIPIGTLEARATERDLLDARDRLLAQLDPDRLEYPE